MIRKQLAKKALAVLAILAVCVTGFTVLAQERQRETVSRAVSRAMEVLVTSGAGTQGTYRFMNSNSVFQPGYRQRLPICSGRRDHDHPDSARWQSYLPGNQFLHGPRQ